MFAPSLNKRPLIHDGTHCLYQNMKEETKCHRKWYFFDVKQALALPVSQVNTCFPSACFQFFSESIIRKWHCFIPESLNWMVEFMVNGQYFGFLRPTVFISSRSEQNLVSFAAVFRLVTSRNPCGEEGCVT